mgnify:CR=1 FL=1
MFLPLEPARQDDDEPMRLRSLGVGGIWQVAALVLAQPGDFAASRRKRPAIILPVIILPLPWARGEGGKMMEGKMISGPTADRQRPSLRWQRTGATELKFAPQRRDTTQR